MADMRHLLDSRTKTYEGNLVLGALGHNYATSIPGKDATGASASAATDGYVDLGDGYTQGFANFNLHTIGAGGTTPALQLGAEARVWLQASKDTSFTTSVALASVEFGWPGQSTSLGTSVLPVEHLIKMIAGDAIQTHTRYSVPFHNRYGDQIYRYLRMWVHIGNTLATFAVDAYLSGLH